MVIMKADILVMILVVAVEKLEKIIILRMLRPL